MITKDFNEVINSIEMAIAIVIKAGMTEESYKTTITALQKAKETIINDNLPF